MTASVQSCEMPASLSSAPSSTHDHAGLPPEPVLESTTPPPSDQSSPAEASLTTHEHVTNQDTPSVTEQSCELARCDSPPAIGLVDTAASPNQVSQASPGHDSSLSSAHPSPPAQSPKAGSPDVGQPDDTSPVAVSAATSGPVQSAAPMPVVDVAPALAPPSSDINAAGPVPDSKPCSVQPSTSFSNDDPQTPSPPSPSNLAGVAPHITTQSTVPPPAEQGPDTVQSSHVEPLTEITTSVSESHPPNLAHELTSASSSHVTTVPAPPPISSTPPPPSGSGASSPLSSGQPTPSAHEEEISTITDQPSNETSIHLNGTEDPQQPSLLTSHVANNHSLASNPSNHLPQSPHPGSSLPPQPPSGATLGQSMTDVDWLVPGSPGTHFTKEQHRFALSVLKQLKKHRQAAPFLRPVDIVALKIPDYPQVIKQPMDLTTIETRLGKAGRPCFYRSVDQFVADVQLVFTNCYTYNGSPEVSQYSRMALDLSIQFETQMKKMPFDEPTPFASTSRSPTLAKGLPKSKVTPVHPPPPPPSASVKRKPDSPAEQSPSIISPPNGSLKRRSASPQQSRKKTARTTSTSTPGATVFESPQLDYQPGPSVGRRSSTHIEAAISNRPKRDVKEKEFYYEQPPERDLGPTKTKRKVSNVSPPMIPNTKAEMKFCKDVLREVNKKVYEKFVWPFYEPVDIVKFNIPEYPTIVKKPMDLWTMKQKLDRGEYKSGAAFADDFRLMLNNCFIFNAVGSLVNNCGRQLESLFEAKWAERPPDLIPAPIAQTPTVQSTPEATEELNTIQILQLQVAQLQEKLQVENRLPVGTGPPKKSPASRAAPQSKLTNPNSVAVPPTTSKGTKTNGANSAKVKSSGAAGVAGGRRKSGGPGSGVAKRPSQAHEPVQERLTDPRQTILPQQRPPSVGAPYGTPGAAPPISQPKIRGAPDEDYFEKIDYEQKKDLATRIQNAVEPMQSDAINLIRNSRPDLVAADGEEIELDIDALDDRTLYQLYQLVCAPTLAPPPKKKKKSVAGNGKQKSTTKANGPRKSQPPLALPSPAQPALPPPNMLSAVAPVATEPREAWPATVIPEIHGNGNGTASKSKVKKPRVSTGTAGPNLGRKGVDEGQASARIKDLEQKLHAFDDATFHNHSQSNGGAEASAIDMASYPPPSAGPVEYASSSSESESESDEDSD